VRSAAALTASGTHVSMKIRTPRMFLDSQRQEDFSRTDNHVSLQ